MRSVLPTCLLLAMCILTCWLASQSFLEPSQLSAGRVFVGWICVLSTPAVFSGTAICVAFSQGSVSIRLLSGCCISYLYCLCSLIILGKLLAGETMPDTIELILFSATPIFLWLSVTLVLASHRIAGRRWHLIQGECAPTLIRPRLLVLQWLMLGTGVYYLYHWLEPTIPNATIQFLLVYQPEVNANLALVWIVTSTIVVLLFHAVRLGRIHLFERMPSLFWQYMLAGLLFAFICMAIMSISVRQLRFGSRSYYERIITWGGLTSFIFTLAGICFVAAWMTVSPASNRLLASRKRWTAMFLFSLLGWPLLMGGWALRLAGFRLQRTLPEKQLRYSNRLDIGMPLIFLAFSCLGHYCFRESGLTNQFQDQMFNHNVRDFVTDADYIDHLRRRREPLLTTQPTGFNFDLLAGRFVTGRWLLALKPYHRIHRFFVDADDSPNLNDAYFGALTQHAIRRLEIDGKLDFDLSFISQLNELEHLSLENFSLYTDSMLFQDCPNLSTLDFRNGYVDRSVLYPLSQIPAMTSIQFRDVQILGGAKHALQHTTSLRELTLIGDYHTNEVYELLSQLPALHSFRTSVPPTASDVQRLSITTGLRSFTIAGPAEFNPTQIRLILKDRPHLQISGILKSVHGTRIRAKITRDSFPHWAQQLGWD